MLDVTRSVFEGRTRSSYTHHLRNSFLLLPHPQQHVPVANKQFWSGIHGEYGMFLFVNLGAVYKSPKSLVVLATQRSPSEAPHRLSQMIFNDFDDLLFQATWNKQHKHAFSGLQNHLLSNPAVNRWWCEWPHRMIHQSYSPPKIANWTKRLATDPKKWGLFHVFFGLVFLVDKAEPVNAPHVSLAPNAHAAILEQPLGLNMAVSRVELGRSGEWYLLRGPRWDHSGMRIVGYLLYFFGRIANS